ncbi:hypothetical protein BDZ85DRAFT_286646 [Elsinoe ampelina]|uniref:Uncharacterized protein n=1 Tax=Elsinoe ampelina TaxID=302913 RepID=A0A6A6FXY8_9PEZI|nr:hypothetical protein BDZ85DRAFT_286646 [Elsinoe ampelina]
MDHYNNPSVQARGIEFCNIAVTYTHAGQGDSINTGTWLPLKEFNGRPQAAGGGRYISGRFELTYAGMAGALAQGYATTSTDAGLGSAMLPDEWALLSPGNVNLCNLQYLGSVSLRDTTLIAKNLISSFYG